jgi:hypothetical protein
MHGEGGFVRASRSDATQPTGGLSPGPLVSLDMSSKGSGWGKFPQFVAYHLLRNKNGDVLSAIMHSYSVTNHNWHYH